MPQQLTLNGVIRGQTQLRKHELLRLGHIVEQRPRQQQAAVDGLRVHSRQEVRDLHHVGGVHQQATQKGMVYALGGGDGRERLPVGLQHGLGHGTGIQIRNGGRRTAQILHRRAAVDGRSGHQGGHIHRIFLGRLTDTRGGELRGAPILAHGTPHLDHGALVGGGQRPSIVPDLQLHRAGTVAERSGQEWLAVGGHLGVGGLEYVVALDLVAGDHGVDGLVVFHRHILPFSYYCYDTTFAENGQVPR